MTKQELRQRFTEKRKNLSAKTFIHLNKALINQAVTLNFKGIAVVHIFLSIPERKEVNTATLIDWLQHDQPQINIVVPRMHPDSLTLTHYLLNKAIVLQKNQWGITEPIHGDIVNEEVIDMVFVPLLCIDKQGHRVGYGKGYYDRFLAHCRPNVKTIGLSLFEPVDAITDSNNQDVALQQCVTPTGVITFAT